MVSTKYFLQFLRNIFWEFWNNDFWYEGVPEKCHRSFVDAVSPDKICFFKIGIVLRRATSKHFNFYELWCCCNCDFTQMNGWNAWNIFFASVHPQNSSDPCDFPNCAFLNFLEHCVRLAFFCCIMPMYMELAMAL